jgi:hypothetical protein
LLLIVAYAIVILCDPGSRFGARTAFSPGIASFLIRRSEGSDTTLKPSTTERADGLSLLGDGCLSIPQKGSTMLPKQLLRTRPAAAYLRERQGYGTPSSLAKWRVTGEGPPFRRSGRLVLYDPDDIDSWAESKLTAPLRSTSEIREAPAPRKVVEPPTQPQLTGPSQVVRRPRGRPRKDRDRESIETADTVVESSAQPTASRPRRPPRLAASKAREPAEAT